MEGKFDVQENCQVTSLNREGEEVGLSAKRAGTLSLVKEHRWP